jgi:hypothetical protein
VTGHTIEEVKEKLAQATNLTSKDEAIIFLMTQQKRT